MYVTTRPIDEPVALFEQHDKKGFLIRVLVFREGLLPAPLLTLLGKILNHV